MHFIGHHISLLVTRTTSVCISATPQKAPAPISYPNTYIKARGNDLTEPSLSTTVQKAGQTSHRGNRVRRKWAFAVCCSIFFFCSWLFWLKKGWKESTGCPGRDRKGDGALLLTPKDFPTDSRWWDQQEQIVYKWKKINVPENPQSWGETITDENP